MFSLHEITRTRWCRRAFLVLCAAPTAAVLGWCVFVNGPAYRRMHQQAIAERLGWQANLTKASSPRPDLLLYEGLDLSDPETGQLLARLPAVEVQSTDDTVTIRLPAPATINGQRFEDFWKFALRQTRRRDDWGVLRFEASHLTLHLALGDQSFTNVTAEITVDEKESRLCLRACRATAGDAATAPLELTMIGRHGAAPGSTWVEFATGPSPLACDLVAPVWPAVNSLGRGSSFQGQGRAVEQNGVWSADLSGRLSGIDLDLIIGQFPHKLSGPATVDFSRVAVRNGRLASAAGTLTAGPGTISRSLIHAAQLALALEASPAAQRGPDNRLAYEQLGLTFDIGPQGLALRGNIPSMPGAVLVDKGQKLLGQPAPGAQPILNLVRTLVPQSAVQVPATQETDGLTHFLPVPSVAIPPGQEAPLPQARSLRLSPPRK